jgi:Holliday junction DNA helicase RuvA
MALGILSGMSGEEFFQSVQNEDVAALIRLPGVGRKTAQRLIVEMRDRFAKQTLTPDLGKFPMVDAANGVSATPMGDAIAALTTLGYRPQDANRMVKAVAAEGLGSEELIRAALQAAAKKA